MELTDKIRECCENGHKWGDKQRTPTYRWCSHCGIHTDDARFAAHLYANEQAIKKHEAEKKEKRDQRYRDRVEAMAPTIVAGFAANPEGATQSYAAMVDDATLLARLLIQKIDKLEAPE